MVSNDADRLARAYNTLIALRNNVPAPPTWVVGRRLVDQYDRALERLDGLGFNVEEFSMAAEFRDNEDGSVERDLFLTQLESVIGYFEMLTTTERPGIGFKGPRK